MNPTTLKKGCAIALLAYLIAVLLFYWIGGEQFHYRNSQTDMLTPSGVVNEITSDVVLEQKIEINGDELIQLDLVGATYARQNTGTLHLEICDLDGQVLTTYDVSVSQMQDNAEFAVVFPEPVSVPEGKALLRITAPGAVIGNAVTLYYGNTISASRYEVKVGLSEENKLSINGQIQDYALSIRVISRQQLLFGTYYWYLAAIGLVLFLGLCIYLIKKSESGKRSWLLDIFIVFDRYHYLMKQLVARDFKTKYKRSVLGMLWSFLNPLLTMLVQYAVFSTLFKSDIPNFALYLLIGIVCFNFFSEATNMCLMSIVGNASLITKVYMPKYIYPLTRVMSSTINFLLALVPLFVVMVVTGSPIRPAILLLPIGLGCLFCIALGIGMLLSSAMVFFRDTQFLWGVLSMLWMYATPIFYPESIIPANLMGIYKMNPLYHVVRFIRAILIDGVSPEPKAYGFLLLSSLVPLIIGIIVFKKTQDKFVLNL
ncbi:ABC transporter permease [Anaerotruncus colihominis]|nr:ABC transporter permease [Anaerotruncus colihominis]